VPRRLRAQPCHCVQLVLGLNQRNVVFAFKERKDRLDLQVVGVDLLADLQREEGLIEGDETLYLPTASSCRKTTLPVSGVDAVGKAYDAVFRATSS
jgi:hypothetical protein